MNEENERSAEAKNRSESPAWEEEQFACSVFLVDPQVRHLTSNSI